MNPRMRTRTFAPSPASRRRSWEPAEAAPDAAMTPFSPAARTGHHLSGVSMIQRQKEDGPGAVSESSGSAAETPGAETKPTTPAAPEAPQALSKSDADGTTTVKDPPTVIHDQYSGATLKDVAAAMPKEAGSASFEISASTEGSPITSATVTVTQEVHLPQWIERDRQCAAVQKAWDDFYGALKIHEDGHVSINQSAFAGAHRRFKGQASSQTQSVTDKIKKEAQKAGDEYDDKTKHGLKGNPPTIIDLAASCAAAEAGTTDGGDVAQAKLEISQPGDVYELEADRMADEVMRMADPNSTGWLGIQPGYASLQRKCIECEEEEHDAGEAAGDEEDDKRTRGTGPVQRKEDGPGVAVPDRAVTAARAAGQPLDPGTRTFMESRFGFDFGRVRIHADAEAAEAARSVHARAYTIGSNVVFAAGRYAPTTVEGRRLLAHELTHVVQQSSVTRERRRSSVNSR